MNFELLQQSSSKTGKIDIRCASLISEVDRSLSVIISSFDVIKDIISTAKASISVKHRYATSRPSIESIVNVVEAVSRLCSHTTTGLNTFNDQDLKAYKFEEKKLGKVKEMGLLIDRNRNTTSINNKLPNKEKNHKQPNDMYSQKHEIKYLDHHKSSNITAIKDDSTIMNDNLCTSCMSDLDASMMNDGTLIPLANDNTIEIGRKLNICNQSLVVLLKAHSGNEDFDRNAAILVDFVKNTFQPQLEPNQSARGDTYLNDTTNDSFKKFLSLKKSENNTTIEAKSSNSNTKNNKSSKEATTPLNLKPITTTSSNITRPTVGSNQIFKVSSNVINSDTSVEVLIANMNENYLITCQRRKKNKPPDKNTAELEYEYVIFAYKPNSTVSYFSYIIDPGFTVMDMKSILLYSDKNSIAEIQLLLVLNDDKGKVHLQYVLPHIKKFKSVINSSVHFDGSPNHMRLRNDENHHDLMFMTSQTRIIYLRLSIVGQSNWYEHIRENYSMIELAKNNCSTARCVDYQFDAGSMSNDGNFNFACLMVNESHDYWILVYRRYTKANDAPASVSLIQQIDFNSPDCIYSSLQVNLSLSKVVVVGLEATGQGKGVKICFAVKIFTVDHSRHTAKVYQIVTSKIREKHVESYETVLRRDNKLTSMSFYLSDNTIKLLGITSLDMAKNAVRKLCLSSDSHFHLGKGDLTLDSSGGYTMSSTNDSLLKQTFSSWSLIIWCSGIKDMARLIVADNLESLQKFDLNYSDHIANHKDSYTDCATNLQGYKNKSCDSMHCFGLVANKTNIMNLRLKSDFEVNDKNLFTRDLNDALALTLK